MRDLTPYLRLIGGLGCALCLVACVGSVVESEGSAEGVSQNTNVATSPSSVQSGSASVVLPFEPMPPHSYVAKVKNILVGTAATTDEVSMVENDPTAITPLIAAWMQSPQYQAKMLEFFSSAFQQTQVTVNDFTNQNGELRGYGANYFLQNMRESFARTVMELISEGRPFTETMTTRRFMLTVPMMVFYGFVDIHNQQDNGRLVNTLTASNPNLVLTFEARRGPISPVASARPNNANYMVWYAPQLATPQTANPNCTYGDPMEFNRTTRAPVDRAQTLYRFLMNSEIQVSGTNNTNCGPSTAYDPNHALITYGDYNQWRMITIRQPQNANEPTTQFYDLPALRSTDTMVLNVPRVGFYTTPAFFAGWQTNGSNQARVTINQALIVGLNHAIDGSLSIAPPNLSALDTEHAPPGSACYACHETLDPMRQVYRRDYSLFFSVQSNPNERNLAGAFAFDGVSVPEDSIADLGNNFANHPSFALAWAQKLCNFANSSACDATDPELQRVAQVFASSNYSWNVLVQTMFASPLVTNAGPTQTAQTWGVTVATTSKERICAALANRLGLTDPCAQQASARSISALRTVPTITQVLPSLQYSRGDPLPVFVTGPSMLYVAGMENLCSDVANAVVDTGVNALYNSGDPNTAIADLVHNVMGVPEGKDAVPIQILADNYAASIEGGDNKVNALRNTFVLGCMSPTAIGL